MSETPKRRWSFSLRTLFVVVTIFACWLGWNVHQLQKREAFQQSLLERGVVFLDDPPISTTGPTKRMPLTWYLLGAKPVVAIELHPSLLEEIGESTITAYFPEAEIVKATMGMSGGGIF